MEEIQGDTIIELKLIRQKEKKLKNEYQKPRYFKELMSFQQSR